MQSLRHWAELYLKHKYQSLCIDIETEGINKPITVIGTYQPREGLVNYKPFIKGKNLGDFPKSLNNIKLLITYNGLKHDMPKIRKVFQIPKLPVIDLYLFAKKLELGTNLQDLEKFFDIRRSNFQSRQRRQAVIHWKDYMRTKNQIYLDKLLTYNKDDTINLFPLAEKLIPYALDRIEGKGIILKKDQTKIIRRVKRGPIY